MVLAYFGHHKCASTWVRRILDRVCREAGLRHSLVVDPLTPTAHGVLTDYRETFQRDDLGAYVQRHGIDIVSCITADVEHLQALGDVRGFHVIRDPRDIVVSAYFSHRNSHPVDGLPHLAEHRDRLQRASKEEGLFLEMEFSRQELLDIAAWDYDTSNVLEVKMEHLTTRPYESFLDIFDFLDLLSDRDSGLIADKWSFFKGAVRNRLGWRGGIWERLRSPMQVSGEMVLGAVYDNRFSKQTGGRKRGREDVNSHYRKGVAGDWENHLSPAHLEHFDAEFGDLLVRLGYEASEGEHVAVAGAQIDSVST